MRFYRRIFGVIASLGFVSAAGMLHPLEVVTQVDDQSFSDYEHWGDDTWLSKLEALDENRVALLTPEGVLEFSNDFDLLRSYRFESKYNADVQFARIDSELYIVGMLAEDSFWRYKNDIHLLRYGESKPQKVWKCTHCRSPVVVYFYDYTNPLLVYASTGRGNQELRVLQLGTNKSWRMDSAGYHLHLERLGIPDAKFGLQNVLITLWQDTRRRQSFPPPTTLLLSEIDLSSRRAHLKDFENDESTEDHVPTEGPHQSAPAEHGDYVLFDSIDTDHVLVGIHDKEVSDVRLHEHGNYLDSHIWWKIDATSEGMYVGSVARPHLLNCRLPNGELLETYVVLLDETFKHPDRAPGSRVYELRPGGHWREIYRSSQRSFGGIVGRENHLLVGFENSVVRLVKGEDYCLESLEQFRESLPLSEDSLSS